MSDEMIQQQTPSKAPYVATGAVIGAGAGALTGAWKPGWAKEAAKYASWDDAVAEMTDKDKFEAAIKDKEADFVTKATEYKDKAVELEKEFNGMIKGTVPEGKTAPEVIKTYNDAMTAYKDALNNKANEFYKEDVLNDAKTKLDAKITEWLGKPENAGKNKREALKALKDTDEYKAVLNNNKSSARRKAVEALAGDEKKTALDNAKKALEEGRTKYINDGMKSFETEGKEKLAGWFKKGSVKGGKLALIMGGGIAAGALLGALLGPKKNKA